MAGSAESSEGICLMATGLNRTGPEAPFASADSSITVAGDMVGVPFPDPMRAGSFGGVDADKSSFEVGEGVLF